MKPLALAPVMPVAPVTSASEAPAHADGFNPAAGLGSSTVEAPATSRADPARKSHHGAFRAPRAGRQGGAGGPGAAQRHVKPRRALRARGVDAMNGLESEAGEEGDDFDERRLRFGYALQSAGANRDEARHGSSDEGARREQHVALSLQGRAAVPVAAVAALAAPMANPPPGPSSLPEGRLLAALAQGGQAEDLAAPLREIVLAAQAAAGGRGVVALLQQTLRAWLLRQESGPSGGTASLARVRAALLAGPTPACAGHSNAQPPSALLWLPVFLLGLDRPRTTGQRAQSMARLNLLLRAAARRSGTGEG